MSNEVAQIVSTSRTIGIGSPRASLQSNFALRTLVGKENFYHGVSDNEHDLANLAIKILRDGSTRTASMSEVETADAVLILGEDLTNTAPMLALAVRQSVRQVPLQELPKINVPLWNDAAARELIQDNRGPLFIATVIGTKLDEVATHTFNGSPEEIARLGFAVAKILDNDLPEVRDASPETKTLAERVATALSQAKRPIIISGASCETDNVMKAAANVAWALTKKNKNTGIVLTLPECNSMGLAMMHGQRLESAFNAVRNGHVDTVIVMENDLFRHAKTSTVNHLFSGVKNIIVLDHTNTATVKNANVLLPAGTFAESDGTLISNEGRAQRFFQVYESTEVIQESWRWLMHIGAKAGKEQMAAWKNFEGITAAIALEEPLLKGVDTITPPSNYRVNGQRIPREPHRFSGRTAMLANVNVSEPKPPVDPDSPLSYTMEGYRGLPPSSMIPFFWSPGWNSVQSINKYQQEVGGQLRGGDPGVRLFEGSDRVPEFFTSVPEKFISLEGHLLMVPVHHIFGSEELSAQSPSVAERAPTPYVILNGEDAAHFRMNENDVVSFEIDGQPYQLPLRINNTIAKGMGGLPYGLNGLPFVELPAWAIIKES
jgi:NADH-quinone oxidoreductase subunit G